VPRHQLADEACQIEIERLGEPIGKHDQYIAAFGGVTCLEIDTKGKVEVLAARVSDETLEIMERNLLLFWTGIERNASEILSVQDQATKRNDQAVINSLHEIKDIGRHVKAALEAGDVDQFGELLHAHWCVKKRLSDKVSNTRLDDLYEIARACGARGGKVIGAGGGGFLMFYVSESHAQVRQAMQQEGMVPMRFRFDHEGTKTLVNV
jgi:D-glycero-alpha-D-manno-heptose-7-phosphate kinase